MNFDSFNRSENMITMTPDEFAELFAPTIATQDKTPDN